MSWYDATHRPQALITIGLVLYVAGVAVFAYAPLLPEPNPFQFVEMVVVGLSGFALIGLIGRLVKRHWPLWRRSYLVAGGVGTLTLLGFTAGEPGAPVWFQLVVSLFLLSGIIVGFGAHLEYGGDREP